MKEAIFFTCSVFCFLLACNSGGESANLQRKKADNEEEVVLRYSSRMIANPRNQAEIDENVILSFLIDSLLDFERTASGIYYHIENPEKGVSPNLKNSVKTHYQGAFLDGRVFDSSYKKGAPVRFKLNEVISGWQEGIRMLKPGGKGTFIIPSRLAYGEVGFPGLIEPNTVLIFDVELISFQ